MRARKEEDLFHDCHRVGKSHGKTVFGEILCSEPDAAPSSVLEYFLPNRNTQYPQRQQHLNPTKCPGTGLRFGAKRRTNSPSIHRSLGQLLASKDMLTGEEADRLRDYVNKAYLDLGRDLKEPYKALFEDGDLTAFQEHFEGRVRHFGGRRHEAAQELFKLRWGPTRVPVYTVLLEFATILPESRYKYIAIIEWLVDTAKVPVDGTY